MLEMWIPISNFVIQHRWMKGWDQKWNNLKILNMTISTNKQWLFCRYTHMFCISTSFWVLHAPESWFKWLVPSPIHVTGLTGFPYETFCTKKLNSCSPVLFLFFLCEMWIPFIYHPLQWYHFLLIFLCEMW